MRTAAHFLFILGFGDFLFCGISIRIDIIFENGYNKYATSF